MKKCKKCKSPIDIIKVSVVLEHFSQLDNGSFRLDSDEYYKANNVPQKLEQAEVVWTAVCSKNKNHLTGYIVRDSVELEEAQTWVVEDTFRNYPIAHNIFKDKKHHI